jgi:DNA-binding PadR family transcriptional regulator
MDTPVESKSQARPLTSTSYALLGLLGLRPWPTYELAHQVKRTTQYMSPRSESNLYAEAKRLVADGLARSEETWNGRRRRTTYSITEAGRDALQDWLPRESGPSRFDSEALLKVFFSNYGSRQQLLASVQAVRDEAVKELDHFRQIAAEYRAGQMLFPERLNINVMTMTLMFERARATVAWADWAIQQVRGWPDVNGPSDQEWALGLVNEIAHDGSPPSAK